MPQTMPSTKYPLFPEGIHPQLCGVSLNTPPNIDFHVMEGGWLALHFLNEKSHEISSFVGLDNINHCNILFSYGLHC